MPCTHFPSQPFFLILDLPDLSASACVWSEHMEYHSAIKWRKSWDIWKYGWIEATSCQVKSQQQKDNTASFHFYEAYKVAKYGASLAVQWLIRLCISNAGGMGLIPGWGTKIPHAAQHVQKVKIKSQTHTNKGRMAVVWSWGGKYRKWLFPGCKVSLMQDLCVCSQSLSPVWLFVIPWIASCQTPLSMRFSRQEYCHFPVLGIFPT